MTKTDEKIDIIIDACEDVKARDIVKLNVENKSDYTDELIIASANTKNQTKAIASRVDEKMKEAGYESYGLEGYKDGSWIVLDYIDVVLHVFTTEKRDYYNLERLWS